MITINMNYNVDIYRYSQSTGCRPTIEATAFEATVGCIRIKRCARLKVSRHGHIIRTGYRLDLEVLCLLVADE